MDSSSFSPNRALTQTDWDNALIRSINTSDNNIELVDELIKGGANVNATILNEFGITQTALMLASEKNHKQSALALINAGADVDAMNEEGWTALSVAAKHGHIAIVNLLLAHANLDSFNDPKLFDSTHPLCFAGKHNHLHIILSLLPNFKIASWNIVTPLDLLNTPLIHISKYNHPAIIEVCTAALSQFDATALNTRDEYGNNLLMLSVMCNFTAIIHALVSLKADLNATNKGVTALMMAAKTNDFAMISILLSARANIEAVNSQGETALSIASKNETKFLLLSVMPVDRVLFYKQSALNNIVTEYIKAVNQFRHELFHNIFSLQTRAKEKSPKELLQLIISYNQDLYPKWYHLRFHADVKAMSERVTQMITSRAEIRKKIGKKSCTAKPLPEKATLAAPCPTFLPIAEMAALTIHTNKEEPTEKKSPKKKSA